MKKGFTLLLLLGGVLLFPAKSIATPPIDLTQSANQTSVTVGDEIVFEVKATHPRHIHIEFTGEGTEFSPFEMKRYRPLPRKESGDQITEGMRYFLTVFKLGDLEIPPIPVAYIVYEKGTLPEPSRVVGSSFKSLGNRRMMHTEPVPIEVKSVLGEKPPETLDIQRLKTPERGVLFYVKQGRVLFLFIGVIFMGVYGVIRLMPKSVPTFKRVNPVVVFFKDYKAFQKELKGVTLSPLHYARLSKLLREYLEQQFDPLPQHLTTEELHEAMLRYPPSRKIAEKTYLLLKTSDLVKFANERISDEEFSSFMKEAEDIVRRTDLSQEKVVAA